MTVHELTTNAAKYGALSAEGGRVDIAWRVVGEGGDRRLAMEWQESGGPPVKGPRRRGHGTRLITGAITHELGGMVRLACVARLMYRSTPRTVSLPSGTALASLPERSGSWRHPALGFPSWIRLEGTESWPPLPPQDCP